MDRSEFRRLERAFKDKNKEKLFEWGQQFEDQIRREYERHYENLYIETLQEAIDNFSIAIAYTLHFSETIAMGADKLPSFMEDLYVTVDLFRRGEYKPEDYAEELKKCGIFISHAKYGSSNHNLLQNNSDNIA